MSFLASEHFILNTPWMAHSLQQIEICHNHCWFISRPAINISFRVKMKKKLLITSQKHDIGEKIFSSKSSKVLLSTFFLLQISFFYPPQEWLFEPLLNPIEKSTPQLQCISPKCIFWSVPGLLSITDPRGGPPWIVRYVIVTLVVDTDIDRPCDSHTFKV